MILGIIACFDFPTMVPWLLGPQSLSGFGMTFKWMAYIYCFRGPLCIAAGLGVLLRKKKLTLVSLLVASAICLYPFCLFLWTAISSGNSDARKFFVKMSVPYLAYATTLLLLAWWQKLRGDDGNFQDHRTPT